MCKKLTWFMVLAVGLSLAPGLAFGQSVNINFQQEGGELVEGYLPDYGYAFGDQGNVPASGSRKRMFKEHVDNFLASSRMTSGHRSWTPRPRPADEHAPTEGCSCSRYEADAYRHGGDE